jgi:hypothetical protein
VLTPTPKISGGRRRPASFTGPSRVHQPMMRHGIVLASRDLLDAGVSHSSG